VKVSCFFLCSVLRYTFLSNVRPSAHSVGRC
jgi:hypothetical protein